MKPNLINSFKHSFLIALAAMWFGGGMVALLAASWLNNHTNIRHQFLFCVITVGATAWIGLSLLFYRDDIKAYEITAARKAAWDAEAPMRQAMFEAQKLNESKTAALARIARFSKTPEGINADIERMNAVVMSCSDKEAFRVWDLSIGALINRAIDLHNDYRIAQLPQPVPRFDFYNSLEWRRVKSEALHKWGRAPCACCGVDLLGREKHVDHIKPRSKYPALALRLSNLQVMCRECNIDKGNRHEVDFRTADQKRRFGAIR